MNGHPFNEMCDSWIAEVRYISRSVPIISLRIIAEGDNDEEIEMDMDWKTSMHKGVFLGTQKL